MNLPLKDKKFLILLSTIAIVVTLEILSILGINIPMPYAPLVFAAFILSIGKNVLWNGVKAIFKLQFSSINLLMTIAVIGAFYLGEYPEAAVVIVLYVLGERLEDIGIENSKSSLDELVSKAPKTAFVKAQNDFFSIDKISVGTIIQIKPGEMIPLDGKIISGETSVDEAAITGEPIPKDKHKGDNLFAGTLNKNGFIELETTKLSIDTTFSKIIRLTFEASANKSETQKFIQKFSKYYTPSIIAMAILVFVIPVFAMQLDFNHWLQQAITLLVIACPCALVISTPVAIYAAIGNASAKGALVKGGKYIEALANIKAIALDKTRTITFGNPIVSDIFPLNGTSREELLACTSGAEIFSEHPLAQAIVDASKKEGFEPHKTEAFKSVLGKGATAKCLVCEDKTIYVGKLEFIKEHQYSDNEAEKIVEQLASQGKTSVVVSFGKGVAGIIGLMDEIKPDSAAALKEIRTLNIEPVMLTGDHSNAAKFVAEQVGIKKIFGNMLPENKADKIKELLLQYKFVAMVGDGINDAPALAQSTVGIAMGAAGSDTAIETANIALMNDKLSLIPFLIRLSKKTLKRIKFNTIGAIAVKLIFIAMAFTGYSNLVFAISADVGVTILVILTSLKLLDFEK
ncbi:MAG: cation-translocating P-type ATPase [Saprospiraceae bacterium]|nr:cation-translocating P-type ATPase [Candidatus Vicinibacter affinis]MBP6091699.1 cation-translocating P-type ATPase [Crocinitomicaceae bacterium]MBP6173405.1 cation-translocating P-type ATPase [Saprospiraceae bacterium]MBK7303031.1 cation-translocating P-type ATPase [Candidatus Vicinibacter affinis]MBK7696201.1 cation-translocating P-type ATPase [Candidatus Vicinibacter affinis]